MLERTGTMDIDRDTFCVYMGLSCRLGLVNRLGSFFRLKYCIYHVPSLSCGLFGRI